MAEMMKRRISRLEDRTAPVPPEHRPDTIEICDHEGNVGTVIVVRGKNGEHSKETCET